MKICLGSKNPVKLKAFTIIVNEFFKGKEVKIETSGVKSLVPDQPIGLAQTMEGAVNRAKNAYSSGKYHMGAGIESGIFKDPTENIYFNTTICALYDGKKIFKGLGPGFKLPEKISKLLVDEKTELDDAVKATGYSDNQRVGYSEGLIGILSNGIIDRMRYTKPAVSMALTAYINDI